MSRRRPSGRNPLVASVGIVAGVAAVVFISGCSLGISWRGDNHAGPAMTPVRITPVRLDADYWGTRRYLDQPR
ncbi:hypothetical protein [Mycobacterium sp.]|jgi:hypothetical protein|uniref:hypothetical protein n=1 Tax=Mycobacterium sp. TaxID=1785 RepID=UPI003BB1C5EE